MVAIVIVLECKDALTKEKAEVVADQIKGGFATLVNKNPLLCHVVKEILVGVDE